MDPFPNLGPAQPDRDPERMLEACFDALEQLHAPLRLASFTPRPPSLPEVVHQQLDAREPGAPAAS